MRRIVFNTLERILSTDLNRLQRFMTTGVAETFRSLLNTGTNSDVQASAIGSQFSTPTIPGRGDVLSGLLPIPTDGTFAIVIEPGQLYTVAALNEVDSSPYVQATLKSPVTLAIDPNVSGSARVDVVVAFVGTNTYLQEADNRDLFSEVTGLFSAATVIKEQEPGVSVSVVKGSPGGGIPALTAGQVPLAVVLIPALAASLNDATLWDVRPLVVDREFAPSRSQSTIPRGPRGNATLKYVAGGGQLAGHIEGFLNGYRVGGKLLRGTPGAETAGVDFSEAVNRASGVTITGTDNVYVYLVCPNGWPRWARYSDVIPGVKRAPRSPRGIVLLSTTAPTNLSGKPSAPIALPSALGFGSVSTSDALCVGWSAIENVFGVDGITTVVWTGESVNNVRYSPTGNALGTSPTTTWQWSMQAGVDYPANVRALLIEFAVTRSVGAASNADSTFVVSVAGDVTEMGNAQYVEFKGGAVVANPTGAPLNRTVCTTLRIPVPYEETPTGFEIQLATTASYGSIVMRIVGYEMGA